MKTTKKEFIMWIILIVSMTLVFSSCSKDDEFDDYCRCKGKFRIESSEEPFFEMTNCKDGEDVLEAFVNLNVNIVYLGCVN